MCGLGLLPRKRTLRAVEEHPHLQPCSVAASRWWAPALRRGCSCNGTHLAQGWRVGLPQAVHVCGSM